MATTTKRAPAQPKEQSQPIRPVKVGKVLTDRFMGIRFEDWDLRGRSVTVSGPNASSKTTRLLAILATFGLVTKRELPEPILRGETEGATGVELIDAETGKLQLIVKRRFVEGKEPELIAVRPDGEKEKKPAEIVAMYIDKHSITPFAWLAHREQDQVDDVLRICSVAVPVAEVEAITGKEHPPTGDESAAQYLHHLSADQTGTYYVERTLLGRTWEQKKKALLEQRERVDALGEAPADDGLDVGQLQTKRAALDAKREQRRALQQNAATIKAELEQAEATLAGLPAELARAQKQVTDTEAEIARLQARLAKERETATALETRIKNGKLTVVEIYSEWTAAEHAVSKFIDPTPDIAAIDEQIRTIDARRRDIAKRQVVLDEFERLRVEEQEAAKAHAAAELTLQQIRDLRRNLLNGVDLGVTGLEIGDGELRFGGVPFRQASQAQRITIAFAIALKRNPNAKFMLLDDGEHLDAKSQAALDQLCERHDIQLIETRVSESDELVFSWGA